MSNNGREISGIHHITAITADAGKNIDFYSNLLGLRTIKLTVNYDDPSAYHLYFGDEKGAPGTVLTFFAWPGAVPGRPGTGQAVACSFSIPQNAMSFWADRLRKQGISFQQGPKRFDDDYIRFSDPDGLKLELVADRRADEKPGWAGGPVPERSAIRCFHNVTIRVRNHEPTARMIENSLGFVQAGESENLYRFETGRGGAATIIDVVESADEPMGRVAVGSIHHIAWRTPNDEEQIGWRLALAQKGFNVTQIIDRLYFRSIYFREPGGALFEIATDEPGFTVDEPLDELGTHLKLPPWMERNRIQIEQNLRPIESWKAVKSS